MFKRISYTIALQFTVFVFLLLIINGAIFLAADFRTSRRQMSDRLSRTARIIMEQTRVNEAGISVAVPPMLREQVRVMDANEQQIYKGQFFEDIPFRTEKGITFVIRSDEQFAVLTSTIERGGELIGYLQVAEVDRLRTADLPPRAYTYILISITVSGMTFLIGLFFARTNLKPAEEMMLRLEQFTQDASHELRTPIATMNSTLDLALRNEKYREGILSAKEDLQQVSVLVERLLELARLDRLSLKRDAIDFSSLVAETLERHRLLAAERTVQFEAEIHSGVTVLGDAALLKQVLTNLLSKAIKFSKPDGGTVHVRLTPKELRIEDTGIGIPRETLPHIFDRFYQVDNSRAQGGFGLGLALAKRIVDLHGWTIEAKSKTGKGTAFTITFPAQSSS